LIVHPAGLATVQLLYSTISKLVPGMPPMIFAVAVLTSVHLISTFTPMTDVFKTCAPKAFDVSVFSLPASSLLPLTCQANSIADACAATSPLIANSAARQSPRTFVRCILCSFSIVECRSPTGIRPHGAVVDHPNRLRGPPGKTSHTHPRRPT
jgi:hypothetical protein